MDCNKPSPSCATLRDLTGFFPHSSLRTGTATTLYAAGVDEQLITEKRDHWSFSVRNFMTSLDKERLVSDIVQERKLSSPPTNKTWDPYHPSVSLQCPSVSVCFYKDASTVTINVKFNSVLGCSRMLTLISFTKHSKI